jgi:predicted O-methyltransferase YrrM
MLRMLAASKPGGRFLELGTGTGIATAWLLKKIDIAAIEAARRG